MVHTLLATGGIHNHILLLPQILRKCNNGLCMKRESISFLWFSILFKIRLSLVGLVGPSNYISYLIGYS